MCMYVCLVCEYGSLLICIQNMILTLIHVYTQEYDRIPIIRHLYMCVYIHNTNYNIEDHALYSCQRDTYKQRTAFLLSSPTSIKPHSLYPESQKEKTPVPLSSPRNRKPQSLYPESYQQKTSFPLFRVLQRTSFPSSPTNRKPHSLQPVLQTYLIPLTHSPTQNLIPYIQCPTNRKLHSLYTEFYLKHPNYCPPLYPFSSKRVEQVNIDSRLVCLALSSSSILTEKVDLTVTYSQKKEEMQDPSLRGPIIALFHCIT